MSKDPDLKFKGSRMVRPNKNIISRPRPPRAEPWSPVYQPSPLEVKDETGVSDIMDEIESPTGQGLQVLISHNF